MEQPLIEFKGVTKRFGDYPVLDGVDLKIYEGHISTIIGKSGTGKSVLLKHIIGLLKPDEGTIFFKGKDVAGPGKASWEEYRMHISYLFQNNALFDSMTVYENVALPLAQTTDMGAGEVRERAMRSIEQTELTDAAEKYPSELSGGMQKRVALARALVTDPRIVLFDEPTTGQDPIRRNAILTMVAEYKRRFGFTAVLISHDIPDIFYISDRIFVLWEGKVAFQGSYEELSTSFEHPMLEEFLHSLEGFQDQLTGLLSRQRFKARYEATFNRGRTAVSSSAILFSVELERLTQEVGHVLAFQIVKSLGEYISSKLEALGGFSARQSMDHILTIFPHTRVGDSREILDDFSRGLKEQVLCDLPVDTSGAVEGAGCYVIDVYAGITEVTPNDEIGHIIAQAKTNQEIIARFQYEVRREQE